MKIDWALVFIFGPLVGLIGIVGLLAYLDLSRPHFSLAKADWTCTQSHSESGVMLVGKAIVPTTHTVCDQWTRK